MALFENYDRRINKINAVLAQYGIGSVEECREICKEKGFDPYEIAKSIQPICFENVCWAYCVGAAIAIKSGAKTAAEGAIGIVKNANKARKEPLRVILNPHPAPGQHGSRPRLLRHDRHHGPYAL